jgi:hypothetical protein
MIVLSTLDFGEWRCNELRIWSSGNERIDCGLLSLKAKSRAALRL